MHDGPRQKFRLKVLDRAALTLVALAVAVPAASVWAAPSGKGKEQEPVCTATPTLEDARLITGRELFLGGNDFFEKKEYLLAVKAWEQVLLLMPGKEAELRVPLAHAHRGAYLAEGDPKHLTSAQELFKAQLESLMPESAERADIETELADVEATLGALAEADARAQAERDAAIREEQIRLNDERSRLFQDGLAKAEARHRRDIQKFYYGVGGSLAGLGVGSLGAMSAFLVGGVRLERDGQKMAASTGVVDGAYQELLAKGAVYNHAAVAMGVVGGVLLTVGGSMMVVAAARYKLAPSGPKRVAVYPTLGGVLLRF